MDLQSCLSSSKLSYNYCEVILLVLFPVLRNNSCCAPYHFQLHQYMQSLSLQPHQGSPLTKGSKYKGACKQVVWWSVGGRGIIPSALVAGTEIACGEICHSVILAVLVFL